jgi:hypothetical protein
MSTKADIADAYPSKPSNLPPPGGGALMPAARRERASAKFGCTAHPSAAALHEGNTVCEQQER